MNKVDVSIIIPIYNTSKYLKTCLDSVVNQTLKTIEIILVNDYSPDPLDDAICREYAEKDNRIIYIQHKENRKQGAARNTGLKEAKGEYIWFVDSDDSVALYACELLLDIAKKHTLDIVGFGAELIKAHEDELEVSASQYYIRKDEVLYKIMSGHMYFEVSASIDSLILQNPPLYLFKRELLKHRCFTEGVYHEDTDFIAILLFEAKRMMIIDARLYFILYREGSTTSQVANVTLMRAKFFAVQRIMDYIEEGQGTKMHLMIWLLKQEYQNAAMYYIDNKQLLTESDNIEISNLYNKIFENMKPYLDISLPIPNKQYLANLEKELLNTRNELSHIKSSFWYTLQDMNRKEIALFFLKKLLKKILLRK